MGADELLDARLAHCVERAVVGGCFCSVAAYGHAASMSLDVYGHALEEFSGDRIQAEETIKLARTFSYGSPSASEESAL